MLDNILEINNEVELAKDEEKITKLKVLELFGTNKISEFEIETYKVLAYIHNYLLFGIYEIAGKIRDVNILKGNFRKFSKKIVYYGDFCL